MIEKNSIKYSLEDISIVPAKVSRISTRRQCNPKTECIHGEGLKMYPIITAPMDSVISDRNFELFLEEDVNVIIPRTVSLDRRLALCKTVFCAFSLTEVENHFLKKDVEGPSYVLIDIANGHMSKQIELGRILKEKYGENLKLMGGNIANPQTYLEYCYSGYDFVRVGIGGGYGCTTSTQCGIHFPMASLLDEISKLNTEGLPKRTKIVADGGIYTYSDAIKCLALGADYVMMGRALAQTIEASGDIYLDGELYRTTEEEGSKAEIENLCLALKNNHKLTKVYHGMSTKEAQARIAGKELIESERKNYKTAEGKTVKELPVTTSLKGWIENFDSYIRSSMSYCDSLSLKDFREMANCIVISQISSNKINNK